MSKYEVSSKQAMNLYQLKTRANILSTRVAIVKKMVNKLKCQLVLSESVLKIFAKIGQAKRYVIRISLLPTSDQLQILL